MLKQTIDILTSYEAPKKICVPGNVAVARGAIEAGVNGVFAYPGTPSTEISEVFKYIYDYQHNRDHLKNFPVLSLSPVYFEYSINEKIALEKAIAYSLGNKSALCVMKNVGMNVASDALMTIMYQTIEAPLVIVVCDDPGCFSSSNEQDSRYWGKFASVPLLNPSNPMDACDMTREAFMVSGQLKLPVMVRMTTRVCHSRGVIFYNKITPGKTTGIFKNNPVHINIPSRTAAAHHQLLAKLNHKLFHSLNRKFSFKDNNAENGHDAAGLITSGVAWNYIREYKAYYPEIANYPVLKINVIVPFPESDVLNFIKNGLKKILVLEELDPIVENEVRLIVQKNNLDVSVFGKGFGELCNTGEFNHDIIRSTLKYFSGCNEHLFAESILPDNKSSLPELPPRPPVLCAGCPHRATFYALKLCIPREDDRIIMCGDIGCFGLGALPPLLMIDTIHHMGMSISMAQGLDKALNKNDDSGKIVALLGDGTFFHSGISSLLNAIYTKANITVIIFDNRTIGMTGHQDHPGASHRGTYKQVEILPLVKGMGVDMVEQLNPFNLKDTFQKIEKAIHTKGVSVLIARAPCIFLPEFKEGVIQKRKIKVDITKCNTCYNHCDLGIYCSKEKNFKNNLTRAKAKFTAATHIDATEQSCPANICNHGFFNSIKAGYYKEALELVRDKMLFSKVCGEICHRPCENYSSKNLRLNETLQKIKQKNINTGKVPIKKLKHLVSRIDDNFYDFSQQINRAGNCVKKNKHIAIVGAGPAGLSAAYDLIQQGYSITLYEKQSEPGGMIRYVIPDFRVDKKSMSHEIKVLEKMGVNFKYNVTLGKDITLEDLSDSNDAIILAIGMWQPVKVDLIDKMVGNTKRYDAVTFLQNFNEKKLKLHKAVCFLIIGGGNSAMDSARAAKELNPKNKVIISCIETRDKMPAFEDEILNTLSRHIKILPNTFIDKINTEKGIYYASLRTCDKNKKSETIKFDCVITATGQKVEKLPAFIKTDKSGRIIKTSRSNIFFAGDIRAGNHISLIGAIGSGKKTAIEVRKFLDNYSYEYEGNKALDNLNNFSKHKNKDFNNFLFNQDNVFLDDSLQEYDLQQTCAKCDHCIDNFGCPAMIKINGKVSIDESRCTLCGLCIDVCTNDAIGWVN